MTLARSDPTRRAPRCGGSAHEPIAIVGIGCRFGALRGPAEFRSFVRAGRNAVRDAPQHRIDLGYDVDHFYDPRLRVPGRISSKKAGFLDHPELFDPAPFGISPRDAQAMEPQQRLMVEVAWDALEDAGIVPASVVGERVAVILGFMAEDYSRERTGVMGEDHVFRGHDVFAVAGISHAVLSGRVSFLLGLKGPSFTLDTACSSSLIATHLACQSLRCGESKLALAGGVNLFLSPEGNIALSRSGMLSASGACKAFDASADGFVRAEGAGIVVLRPLSDALAEGNPIYAVIRGSGVSADGRDGGHMMAPSREGQVQAMRDAYAQAGLAPSEIDYVEAHGTGTMIGDPVEIAALAEVMGPGRSADRPLRVASVKGNLGHAESASGVAGLINAALAVRHRELPAQLHFETPNPAIPWSEVPIRVQAVPAPWPHAGPARVGVNSFGISGTNAHVVLESAPRTPAESPAHDGARALLVALSGHDANALHARAEQHRDFVAASGDEGVADLAYTLAARRTHRAHRLAVVAASAGELRRELDAWLAGDPSAAAPSGVVSAGDDPKVVLVFPGQGGQWRGMGRDLLAREPRFARAVDRLDAAYRAHVDWSLRAFLEGRDGDFTTRLDVLQPVLVAFEIALAELWAGFGIRPHLVIGQSLGEIAAAHVAGGLSLADTARLACQRGAIVARAAGRGAMAVVFAEREHVERVIRPHGGRVEVAGANAPTTTIVSGDRDAVIAAVASFEAEGVFARRLAVDFASHCFHMDPLLAPFRTSIDDVAPVATQVPFVSTLDGRPRAGEALDADYWVRNLRAPVALDRALATALEAGGRIFLEVSPHPTLSRAIAEAGQAAECEALHVPSLQRDADGRRALATSLGSLFVRGAACDPAALGPPGRVVETPLYPYQRRRHWFSERTRAHVFRPVHPLLGARSQSSVDPRLHTWDFVLDADSAGFVADFRDQGETGAPAGLFPELALGVAEAMWPGARVGVAGLEIRRPLALGRGGRRRVQVVLRVDGERRGALRIASREDESAPWALHATAALRPADERALEVGLPRDRDGLEALDVDAHFTSLEACGLCLGSRGRALRELRSGPAAEDGVLLARLKLPRAIESEWYAFRAHPTLLEAAAQVLGARRDPPAAVRVCAIRAIDLGSALGSDVWCRVQQTGEGEGGRIEADIAFFDPEGRPLGALRGVCAAVLPARSAPSASSDLHGVEWQPVAVPTTPRAIAHWLVLSDAVSEAGLLVVELEKRGAAATFCEKPEDLERHVAELEADGAGPWGLVVLRWASAGAGPTPASPVSGAIGRHARGAAQVWLATRGCQTFPGEEPVREEASVLAGEIERLAGDPSLAPCRLFDASAALDPGERAALAALLGVDDDERHYAGRGDALYVPRLVPIAAASAPPDAGARLAPAGNRSFRALHTGDDGAACIRFEEIPAAERAAGEVAVEVRAAGLAALDVLSGLGLDRSAADGPKPVGWDFAGVVADADPDSGLAPGDAVIGVHEGALGRRRVVPVSHVVGKPPALGWCEAAAAPFAYLTAKLALGHVARLRAGERLLLPSAGGGVGLALVGVARALGADVHATASSPARRAALQALGARLVDATDAEGPYDVVASGRTGADVHALLAQLAPRGRYVDLCPRARFERAELGALDLGANRTLSSLDVPALLRAEPVLVASLLEEIARDLERGRLGPLPTTVFAGAQAGRALRFMAQNRHAGRVCVDLVDAERVPTRARARECTSFAMEAGPCLVSGGEPTTRAAVAARLRAGGAEAVVERAADALSSDDVMSRSWGTWIHLCGPIGSPSDGVRPRPHVPARRHVRVCVRVVPDARPGDRNDCAWESGLLWSERLRLSHGDVARTRLLSIGPEASADEIADRIEAAWAVDAPAQPLVVLDGVELARRIAPAAPPLLAALARAREDGERPALRRDALLAATLPERRRAMQHFVVAALAGVLGLSEEERAAVDGGSRLAEMGLDSLMTMELFTGIAWDLQLEIAPDWFPPNPTLAEIGGVLADRLEEASA